MADFARTVKRLYSNCLSERADEDAFADAQVLDKKLFVRDLHAMRSHPSPLDAEGANAITCIIGSPFSTRTYGLL